VCSIGEFWRWERRASPHLQRAHVEGVVDPEARLDVRAPEVRGCAADHADDEGGTWRHEPGARGDGGEPGEGAIHDLGEVPPLVAPVGQHHPKTRGGAGRHVSVQHGEGRLPVGRVG
jgi:hypothetical protein